MAGVNRNGMRFQVLFLVASLLPGCHGNAVQNPESGREVRGSSAVLRIATTTSTRDSGLLDVLLPVFQRQADCRVDAIAMGTGAALKLGEAGDADLLLVHARAAEEAFMEAGHGIRHEEFMYNHFVILGPKDDPAAVRDLQPKEALQRIAEGKHRFLSRGDDSGTYKRELQLWQEAGGRPSGDPYVESGQGMGPTLVMADEMEAYVLADTGTYLNFEKKIDLIPLVAQAEGLRNPYAAIVVNPNKHENLNARLANDFVDFLLSSETQQQIKDYRIDGRPLFHPTRPGGA